LSLYNSFSPPQGGYLLPSFAQKVHFLLHIEIESDFFPPEESERKKKFWLREFALWRAKKTSKGGKKVFVLTHLDSSLL